jgi:hypothetical protein
MRVAAGGDRRSRLYVAGNWDLAFAGGDLLAFFTFLTAD